MHENIITFIRQRDYKEVELLGQGGTGQARLLLDDVINEHFVCKKYAPFYPEHKEKYFNNFVEEIKLLHLVYHKNIVRVFNYFLYPEHYTGYILMEYIKGESITEYCRKHPEEINSLFEQTIEAFRHLEELQILHRDIRPANIMVSDNGIIKVIDFGFGKKIDFGKNDFNNSVNSINWYYDVPDEFENEIYDFSSEVYFVGKLFEDLLRENLIATFKYGKILQEMGYEYLIRLGKFSEISRLILNNVYENFEFSTLEKKSYLQFVKNLSNSIASLGADVEYIKDTDIILSKLEQAYRDSMLEVNVQYIPAILGSFLKGTYKFYNNDSFSVYTLKEFIRFFKSLVEEKRKIVLNNIWNRMRAIPRTHEQEDDLPF